MSDPSEFDASTLSRMIHARQLSCREVMEAFLDRIHADNPRFNAIVNLAEREPLLAQARARDAELAAGQSRGWLHGIPLAVKDTTDATGFPTTKGSRLLRDAMPASDSIMVERLKACGAIVIGKTNVPELALGSHTFNDLFGATKNAWDPAVSAGGSSGGAAVAVARRMLPLADGSDLMGSLRNPAAWNAIFALRPTQGRVPEGPGPDVWVDQMATSGPMARSAEDLARLLRVQSGHDARQPLSLQSSLDVDPSAPVDPAQAFRGLRIAWLGDLGGRLATEPGVLEVCESALHELAGQGARVDTPDLGFDLEAAWQCWMTLRKAMVGARVAPLLVMPGGRDALKPEALWEYETSQDLSYASFYQASLVRSRFYQHLRTFFQRWDVIALPSAQVWPFELDQRWPRAIAGRDMDTYHRWMEVSIYATLTGCPALSLPAGFHPRHGWPMGLQLIAPHSADDLLLRTAKAYEQVRSDLFARRPPA